MIRSKNLILDTSVLIDLHKAGLLDAVFAVPYGCVVPLVILEETKYRMDGLYRVLDTNKRINKIDMSNEMAAKAKSLEKDARGKLKLSFYDSSMIVIAGVIDNPILLTGDRRLRKRAECSGLHVRGVLWLFDEISAHTACKPAVLVRALKIWRDDDDVFLPPEEIDKRIVRLSKK